MSYLPKTPSRRSRSEAKTPLTSLTSGLNSLVITSPTKSSRTRKISCKSIDGADISNPFITQGSNSNSGLQRQRSNSRPLSQSMSYAHRPRSRPGSPIKRGSNGFAVNDELQREASGGLLSRSGVKAGERFDVIKFDYVPATKVEMKRSKSQPGVKRDRMMPRSDSNHTEQGDRFITNRADEDLATTLELMHLSAVGKSSPGHTARVASAAGVNISNRVLAFHELPPSASSDPLLKQQREIVKPLYDELSGSSSQRSLGSSSGKTRKISNQPERVLDAPGMLDDFYLNLLSWSCLNVVAVSLGESTYTWRADTGAVSHLGDTPEGSYVSSVEFSQDGAYLAIGTSTGAVELWDIEGNAKLRTMHGHQAQIPSLSWNGHILSSGCGDGSIWNHDVRVPRHKVGEMLGHVGEVCGLKWRHDGELLASGGNDNVVNVWDARVGDVNGETRGRAKWTKRNHTAAVKAIAWCPWQPSLLATGGGTNDAHINVWNVTTGARLHTHKTPSQITSLHFSPHRKEILSTHGFPTNSVMVHSYPSFERVAEIKDAHESRVLFSCVGPEGDLVVTGAGDENLKFWRIWEVPKAEGKGKGGGARRGLSSVVNDGIRSIR